MIPQPEPPREDHDAVRASDGWLTDAEVELLMCGAAPDGRADLAATAAVLAAVRDLRGPALSMRPELEIAVRRTAAHRRAATVRPTVPRRPSEALEPVMPRAGRSRSSPGRDSAGVVVATRRRLQLAAAAALAVVALLTAASREALPGDLQRVVSTGASVIGLDLPDGRTTDDAAPPAGLGRIGVRRALDPSVAGKGIGAGTSNAAGGPEDGVGGSAESARARATGGSDSARQQPKGPAAQPDAERGERAGVGGAAGPPAETPGASGSKHDVPLDPAGAGSGGQGRAGATPSGNAGRADDQSP